MARGGELAVKVTTVKKKGGKGTATLLVLLFQIGSDPGSLLPLVQEPGAERQVSSASVTSRLLLHYSAVVS